MATTEIDPKAESHRNPDWPQHFEFGLGWVGSLCQRILTPCLLETFDGVLRGAGDQEAAPDDPVAKR